MSNEAFQNVLPEILTLSSTPNGDTEVVFVCVDDKSKVEKDLASFLYQNTMEFSPYYNHIDSVKELVSPVYPAWNQSLPLTMIYKKEGEFIEGMGLTDRNEIEMIISQDKTFTP